MVEEAVECSGVSPDDAGLMLRQRGWDLAAFNEAFFENPEAERRRAGVCHEAGGDAGVAARPQAAAEGNLCGICFAQPGAQVLPCERGFLRRDGALTKERHPSYCRDCWRQYLGHAVAEGKSCLDLRCPTPGCGEAPRPGHVEALLGPGAALERYRRFLAESLVDDSRGRLRWCPGQGCGRAAEEPATGRREVACPCGVVWCFGCGTDAHLPVSCETVRRWESKNRDEGGDATWIRVNTKFCPRCQNPIEKNGGCMHMTCRKPGGCGHEFCWICMRDWKGHQSCNATPESKAAVDEKARAKSELMRYAHFYERYMAHHKAQQFAATEQMQGMETLASLLCTNHSWKVADVVFLTTAVSEIAASRRFLKWTYAYAFFAGFNGDQRKLFEFHQAQLEGTLERLSDLMENTQWDAYLDPDAESMRPLYDLRTQLISLTDVVHKFFAHLSEAIEQGTLFSGAA
uniref:RBR-type E3 ubiquitin transferase n=1 Tax=Pyrodinium bahamense TaxID=73915 RepID=A0A7S0ABC2_9DINO